MTRLFRRSGLVHGTAWMFFAQSGGLLCQVGYFVVAARALGVNTFGQLAASLALVAIFVPFSAWGSGNLIVMDVVRDPRSFSVSFGNALVSIGATAVVLVPLTLLLAALFLPKIPLAAILLLALADLGFGRVTGISAPAFQGFERFGSMTAVSLVAPIIRLAAIVVFAVFWDSHDLVTWTALYFLGTVTGATIATWYTCHELGRPHLDLHALRKRVKLGGYFAVGLSAGSIYGDIDKTMLGRLSTFDAAGIYAAADRAVGMAFMPIMAMLSAAYPRFFRAGTAGIHASAAYARRLLPAATGYGLLAGIGIFVLAPLAPHILGADFAQSVGALRWLAPVPLLSVLYYLPADALTGADAQGLRTIIQVVAAALNVGLNILLIPEHSWEGAAWATLATLGFLAAALWLAVGLTSRTATSPSASTSPTVS
ncbi:MAG: hypothetical protein QOG99_2927 [Frankiales bacterium]|nr:hypothetical protein [Frankiales bacterium]